LGMKTVFKLKFNDIHLLNPLSVSQEVDSKIYLFFFTN